MKTCGDKCIPMCNHCTHMLRVGQRRCEVRGVFVHPTTICNDFECRLIESGVVETVDLARPDGEPEKAT